jgi:hypothetical protein
MALEVIGHLKFPVGALCREFDCRGTEAFPLVSEKLLEIRMALSLLSADPALDQISRRSRGSDAGLNSVVELQLASV